MKTLSLLAAVAVSLLAAPDRSAVAADTNTNSLSTQLGSLVMQINTKLKAGQDTEKDLAPEMKQFDALLAAHSGEKTDEIAQVLFMKAMLYVQVFENTTNGAALLQQVTNNFAGTDSANKAADILQVMQKEQQAVKLNQGLAPGTAFPEFSEKDLEGKPLSVSALKGKVVLIDFWATWCGPCVRELPNVLDTYKQYHDKGFDIIGVSLDEDKDKLESFLKSKQMTWPQYFDGQGWQNKISSKYGIMSIPATFLLDRQGKIIARDLRGEQLKEAVAKAVAAK
ncbi:MAG: TlpA disulfide reductase family protein [Verrucomicrobiota bacterium]